VWSAGAAVVAAVLGWTVARRTADATVSSAWRELLQPLRDELGLLRDQVSRLERDNGVLATQLATAQHELGVLRRLERASTIRTTADAAVLRSTLDAAGITVPDVQVDPPPLERTRSTDREQDYPQ
jgi:hypothetical protein